MNSQNFRVLAPFILGPEDFSGFIGSLGETPIAVMQGPIDTLVIGSESHFVVCTDHVLEPEVDAELRES